MISVEPHYAQGHGKVTAHKPEVILNNFTTRLGHTVARMLASLFPQEPQFQGRRAVTFHNQRDYIFIRHHRQADWGGGGGGGGGGQVSHYVIYVSSNVSRDL